MSSRHRVTTLAKGRGTCVCVCVCACVRARAGVRACVCARTLVCAAASVAQEIPGKEARPDIMGEYRSGQESQETSSFIDEFRAQSHISLLRFAH